MKIKDALELTRIAPKTDKNGKVECLEIEVDELDFEVFMVVPREQFSKPKKKPR
ncbi:MAG: hypothetical protein LBH44_00275 [Treponema sp.]|jgi:hypothetical protein|nr:hypothetical protein [Treponema sp.]